MATITLISPYFKHQIMTSLSIEKDGEWFCFNALWDTGANQTNIGKHIIEQLNFIPQSSKRLVGIKGDVLTNTYIVNLKLNDKIVFNDIEVISSDIEEICGFDAIIGMDIISQGDFYITHFQNNNGEDEIRFDFTYPPLTK